MKKGLVVVTVMLMASAAFAWAPGLYGGDSWGGFSSVWKMSTATGAATKFVGSDGDFSFSGFAFLGGKLYVSDYTSFTGWVLGWVDETTGKFTQVSDQGPSSNWHGLASDGKKLWSMDIDQGNVLAYWDPGTGTVGWVGGPGAADGRGMEFVGSTLYATGGFGGGTSLYTISTATGAATLVGPMGIDSYLVGLAYDQSSGTMYANDGLSGNLYKVSLTTGAATLVGPNGVPNIDALGWIPEPTSLGLLAFGLLALRRR